MSIIDQTLRELDARHAHEMPQGAPAQGVAVPAESRTGWRVAVFAGVLAVLVAAAVVLMRGGWRASPAPHAAPPASRHPAPVAAAPVPPASLAAGPPAPRAAEASAARVAPPERAHADAGGTNAPRTTPPSAPAPLDLTRAAGPSGAIRKDIHELTPEALAEDDFRRARELLTKGRDEAARRLLETLLERAPKHVAARQTLAALLADAGQVREAERILAEGHTLFPENAWFAQNLARLQAARGDTGAAIATLRESLAAPDVDADYAATLAGLLVRAERFADAEPLYRKALASRPRQGTWWMGLGLALQASGKADEARDAFERALASGNLPDDLAAFVRGRLGE